MKIENLKSNSGKNIANQFIVNDVTIKHVSPDGTDFFYTGKMFQSYNSNIAFITDGYVLLDKNFWNYSRTTSKYRNIFLNETTKETLKKIESKEYILMNLN